MMMVKELDITGRKEALQLALEVFMQFEAPDYPAEGIEEFTMFVRDIAPTADMKFWGAYEGDELVGMIATRPHQHISLFFVKASHHHEGIGKELFKAVCNAHEDKTFTVNSSPYAVEIYRHLGFRLTDKKRITNGIIYYPMKYESTNND